VLKTPLKHKIIQKYVLSALREDNFRHDLTSRVLISPSHHSKAEIIFKEEGILCGIECSREAFRLTDSRVLFKSSLRDGAKVKKGTVVARIHGRTLALLTAERTALNFLGYLSGIATQTARYVQAIRPFKSKILDTRKTTPTMRVLEKYAVQCGGGTNHRFSLSDMILVKDNHLKAASISFAKMVPLYKKTKLPIEIEVETFAQLKHVLKVEADIVLLDNMSIDQLRKVVQYVRKAKIRKKPLLEASGGITLDNVKRVAATGVDRISIGALTHTHKSVDVSLEFV
jgi:nicotinate-nucleotide pyrophosphorylase (carboxylating)